MSDDGWRRCRICGAVVPTDVELLGKLVEKLRAMEAEVEALRARKPDLPPELLERLRNFVDRHHRSFSFPTGDIEGTALPDAAAGMEGAILLCDLLAAIDAHDEIEEETDDKAKHIRCPYCDGTGCVDVINDMWTEGALQRIICPYCDGTGNEKDEKPNIGKSNHMRKYIKVPLQEISYYNAYICDGAVWFDTAIPIGVSMRVWDEHYSDFVNKPGETIKTLDDTEVMMCATNEYLIHYDEESLYQYDGGVPYILDIEEVIKHWNCGKSNIIIDLSGDIGYIFTPNMRVINRDLYLSIYSTIYDICAVQSRAEKIPYIKDIRLIEHNWGPKELLIRIRQPQEWLQEAVEEYMNGGINPSTRLTQELFGDYKN